MIFLIVLCQLLEVRVKKMQYYNTLFVQDRINSIKENGCLDDGPLPLNILTCGEMYVSEEGPNFVQQIKP